MLIMRQVRVHGRRGLAAQRYNIDLAGKQYPVLVRLLHQTAFQPMLSAQWSCNIISNCMQPRVVHINAVSNLVENITFMHCPPGRQVSVPVPVQVC